jgi:hypothetical protein
MRAVVGHRFTREITASCRSVNHGGLALRKGKGYSIMIDFELTREQQGWQKKSRDFAEREIKPFSLKLDRSPDRLGQEGYHS